MYNKLDKLVQAMTEVEGWNAMTRNSAGRGSRSYRNHNPLNLRKSPFEVGNDDNFSVFLNDNEGLEAAKWDIRQKAQGNTVTGLKADSTLADLIRVWAPEEDNNDPQNYLNQVLTKTGFNASITLREITAPK